MAPIQAIRSLPLPMRSAGFLLPSLAALALASCAAPPPPPSPPPTASVPPPAPQQQAPPPATPAQSQAPFVSPEEMALSPSRSAIEQRDHEANEFRAMKTNIEATAAAEAAQKSWEAAVESRISEYSQQQNLGGSSSCYTGPRGGTYTLTRSGKKNYGGC